jgi:hypothetical protein
MSNKSYNRKAQRFTINNPDADATPRQVATCKFLLRSRDHDVEFGNDAIDLIDGGMTRADADGIIKHLAGCPSIKRQTKAEVVETTDAVIARMAREGKLGKVAQRKALAL